MQNCNLQVETGSYTTAGILTLLPDPGKHVNLMEGYVKEWFPVSLLIHKKLKDYWQGDVVNETWGWGAVGRTSRAASGWKADLRLPRLGTLGTLRTGARAGYGGRTTGLYGHGSGGLQVTR